MTYNVRLKNSTAQHLSRVAVTWVYGYGKDACTAHKTTLRQDAKTVMARPELLIWQMISTNRYDIGTHMIVHAENTLPDESRTVAIFKAHMK